MRKKSGKAAGLGASESEARAWGKGEYANMPQDVVKELYPRNRPYRGGDIDDTINEIDDVIDRSEKMSQKNLSNQH